MNDPVIEASQLYRFYHAEEDETFALRGASLAIGKGEFVQIETARSLGARNAGSLSKHV